jgi:hypothetical protein
MIEEVLHRSACSVDVELPRGIFRIQQRFAKEPVVLLGVLVLDPRRESDRGWNRI